MRPDDLTAMLGNADLPPEQLLQRILASRSAGRRTILPVAPRTRPVKAMIVRGSIAAALAVLLLGAGQRWLRHREPDTTQTTQDFFFPFDELTAATVAAAQSANPLVTYPPMTPDVARLRPLILKYSRRYVFSGRADIIDTIEYQLTPPRRQNEGWHLITNTWRPGYHGQVLLSDTLWFAPNTLVPMLSHLNHVHCGEARLSAAVWYSTARMRIHEARWGDCDQQASKILPPNPRHPADTTFTLTGRRVPQVAGMGDLALKLMASSITPGWRRSAVLVPPGLELPMNIQQVDNPSAAVDSGPRDCWLLEARMHYPDGEVTMQYSVRKTDGITARVHQGGLFQGEQWSIDMRLFAEH